MTLPDGSSTTLYVVLCGVKGDWPYLSISEALAPCMHVSVHGFCFPRTVRKMPFTMDRLHQPEKVPLLSILWISHAPCCCRFGCVHGWPCWPSIVCPGLVEHESFSTMEIWTAFRWKPCLRPPTSHAYTSWRGAVREPPWPNAYMAPWYWTRICGLLYRFFSCIQYSCNARCMHVCCWPMLPIYIHASMFFCFMRFFWHAASKSGEVPISKKDYEELLHRSMHGGLPTKWTRHWPNLNWKHSKCHRAWVACIFAIISVNAWTLSM